MASVRTLSSAQVLDDGDLLTDRERVGKAALTHEASKLVKGAHEALRPTKAKGAWDRAGPLLRP